MLPGTCRRAVPWKRWINVNYLCQRHSKKAEHGCLPGHLLWQPAWVSPMAAPVPTAGQTQRSCAGFSEKLKESLQVERLSASQLTAETAFALGRLRKCWSAWIWHFQRRSRAEATLRAPWHNTLCLPQRTVSCFCPLPPSTPLRWQGTEICHQPRKGLKGKRLPSQ